MTYNNKFPFSAYTPNKDASPVVTSLDVFLYELLSQPLFAEPTAADDMRDTFEKAYTSTVDAFDARQKQNLP